MNLRSLLEPLALSLPDHSAFASTVEYLRTDSRHCQRGDLFIGMPGTQVDGGLFWPKAMELGAIVLIPGFFSNVVQQSLNKTNKNRGSSTLRQKFDYHC